MSATSDTSHVEAVVVVGDAGSVVGGWVGESSGWRGWSGSGEGEVGLGRGAESVMDELARVSSERMCVCVVLSRASCVTLNLIVLLSCLLEGGGGGGRDDRTAERESAEAERPVALLPRSRDDMEKSER